MEPQEYRQILVLLPFFFLGFLFQCVSNLKRKLPIMAPYIYNAIIIVTLSVVCITESVKLRMFVRSTAIHVIYKPDNVCNAAFLTVILCNAGAIRQRPTDSSVSRSWGLAPAKTR